MQLLRELLRAQFIEVGARPGAVGGRAGHRDPAGTKPWKRGNKLAQRRTLRVRPDLPFNSAEQSQGSTSNDGRLQEFSTCRHTQSPGLEWRKRTGASDRALFMHESRWFCGFACYGLSLPPAQYSRPGSMQDSKWRSPLPAGPYRSRKSSKFARLFPAE